MEIALDHMEAIVLAVSEPPHNRQGGRFGTDGLDPGPDILGHELRAVAPREEALSEVMATRVAPK